MVDWSFDLLNPQAQGVLCRLSVFVGGFDLQAAEAVCAPVAAARQDIADVLASLVNKSLVVTERSSGSLGYKLLETIRQYAADRLAGTNRGTEAAEARRAHAEYYLKLSEEAAPELVTRGQGHWLRQLDRDWDNLQAALSYFSAVRGQAEEVLRFGVALYRYFWSRGHVAPIAHLRAALERHELVPDVLRTRALLATGYLLASLFGMHRQADMRSALELSEQAVEIARRLEDSRLIAETLTLRFATGGYLGEPRAAELGQEALEAARSTGDPRLVGDALYLLAYLMPTSATRRAAQITGAHDVFYSALVAAAPTATYEQDPSDQKLRDDNRTRLREAMGEEEFERAYTIGKSLDLEQSCDLALGKTSPK
jgi:non-specific serine/threonine protein kinase